MSGTLLRIAFRNIFRQKRRTLLTVLTITVGVWSCLALATLARGIGKQMSGDVIKTFMGTAKLHQEGYLDDPVIQKRFKWPDKEIQEHIKQDSKITSWAARLRVPGVIMSERESYGVTLLGVDPQQERVITFLKDAPVKGSFLSSVKDQGVILGEALAEKLQVEVGKRIVLMSEDAHGTIGDRGFRIKGIYRAEIESTEKSYVLVGRTVLQEMLHAKDEITEVSLLASDVTKASAFVRENEEAYRPLVLTPWDKIQPMIGAMLKMQDGFLLLWFGIVVIAVVFGLTNSLFMVLLERTREFGMMLALGMRPSGIIMLVAAESFLLLLIGAVLGNSLTALTTYFLRDGIDLSAFAKGVEVFGAASVVYPEPLASDWILGNVLIIGFGVICSLYPAWKASRLRPVEAIFSR